MKRHAFLVLDGMRGIAAISVLLMHYGAWVSGGVVTWPPAAFLAVDFFFALSGFVVAHAYEKTLLAKGAVRAFMLKRIIRLYPLYVLSLTLSFLFHPGIHIPYAYVCLSYGLSLFFLPTPALWSTPDQGLFPLNLPAWTLSAEIWGNLLYAHLCARLTTPRLITFLIISAPLLGYAIFFFANGDMGIQWDGFLFGFARMIFSFVIGVVLYRFHSRKKRKPLSRFTGGLLIVVLFADFSLWQAGWFHSFISYILVFPILIWFGAAIRPWAPLGWLYGWLGRTSYALYIVHIPFWPVVVYFLFSMNVHQFSKAVALSCAMTIITATLLDHLYDVPARRFFAKLLDR